MKYLLIRFYALTRPILVLLLFFVGLIGIIFTSSAATSKHIYPLFLDPQDTFPIPSNIPNQLFYLQRTTNTNTIIYALNTNSKGVLDDSNPIKIFWIRYSEGGMRKELNLIQRTFAYGTMSEKNNDGSFSIRLVAYKKHELVLRKLPTESGYRIFTLINKKYAILNRVFIRIDAGGSLFKPNIVYIELKGTELATGKTIVERFKP
ncbi:MAG: DUF4833 domain-containing protein [Sphingobacteriia bacterium]|nr:MAG: DUF4833 domain-containing protein [Sphingobacteriia bacterium]TAH09395.1 MAG: DUF4833 domain-containing protein [Sphingobacteriia bacterium]